MSQFTAAGIRFDAIHQVQENANGNGVYHTNLIENFSKLVFNNATMRRYLSKNAYSRVIQAIDEGTSISLDVADQVARGMIKWATEHGATHYTHWFQPLTGLTAEKHDSFLDVREGVAIENFNGKALIQQEPDASSFPSGGIRNTFEARGYTAWDPSSPAFLMTNRAGTTLCIPTIFVSYTGEALDYKAPLLKALHRLQQEVVPVCKYFNPEVEGASATLGTEQEYFLIDAKLYNARPDLVLAKRTMIGQSPAKGHELDDHYFGSIPERVHSFMVDLEQESHRLGIPLTTRHNEVAPSQFECAPVFEEANLAVDHNQLLLDLLDKVSRRHNMRAISHEKPFAGVNGSGKHNNWSVGTDTGINLLSPGKNRQDNLRFLTFFINIIKSVYDNADLLRASIASHGNDHRLGANEAPPAIISIFIGSQLTQVLEKFEKGGEDDGMQQESGTISVPTIPEIRRDNTDRNRTSPFAFTGNKFEFRAVGSAANTASPMIVLNTALADQLRTFRNAVENAKASGKDQEQAIVETLQGYIKEARPILFEGDNYAKEWEKEAKKRGLSNIKTTPKALDAYISKKSLRLFSENGVLTERELRARHEISQENYAKSIQIEARILGELVDTHVIPAAVRYLEPLIQNTAGLEQIGLGEHAATSKTLIKTIQDHINGLREHNDKMKERIEKANEIEDAAEMAEFLCRDVKEAFFEPLRTHADALEALVDDQQWSLPKYRELLFLR